MEARGTFFHLLESVEERLLVFPLENLRDRQIKRCRMFTKGSEWRERKDLSEAMEEALDDEGDDDHEGANGSHNPRGSELQLHLAPHSCCCCTFLRHSHAS
ncbi:hypothetical protein BHE74_00049759 [Ensete ventricosum]|nr:hypothetical protein GW17_00022962 [Ensete ventricosum]RWW44473.1 hypothetical protein BHE74_00049759 [Ensete ventricosum]